MKFSLTVKDDKGFGSSPAIVTVNVKPVNHPPITNAGSDRTVNAGEIVTLEATDSKDPDGDELTYSWIQTSGPAVKLSNANTAITTFTAPSNISSSDVVLSFRVTVSDDKNAKDEANIRVSIKRVPTSSPTQSDSFNADNATTADIAPTDATKNNYDLMINNQPHTINYSITGFGNQIESMQAITEIEKPLIIVNITSSSDGELTIELPRNIIDSKRSQNNDDEFIVFVDGQYTPADEIDNNDKMRILKIYFEKNTKQIEIVGTG